MAGVTVRAQLSWTTCQQCATVLVTLWLEESWWAESDWRICPNLSDLSWMSQWKSPGLHPSAIKQTVSMRSRQDSINFTRCLWLKRRRGNIRHYDALAAMTAHLDELQSHFFPSPLQSPHLYCWMNSHVWWNQTAFGWSCLINSHPLTLALQQGGGRQSWGGGGGGGGVMKDSWAVVMLEWSKGFYVNVSERDAVTKWAPN